MLSNLLLGEISEEALLILVIHSHRLRLAVPVLSSIRVLGVMLTANHYLLLTDTALCGGLRCFFLSARDASEGEYGTVPVGGDGKPGVYREADSNSPKGFSL